MDANNIKNININTFGCHKNEADSNVLKALLIEKGFNIVEEYDSPKIDLYILNTCCFIDDAKKENINAIWELIECRKQNKSEYHIAIWGCMVQRYFDKLTALFKEVDVFIGLDLVENVADFIAEIDFNTSNRFFHKVQTPNPIYNCTKPYIEYNYYSYLKIGDGCDKNCAFCAIPTFKGVHISRPVQDIFNEAKYLIENGIKEIILIDQDITQYKHDENDLCDLLKLLDNIQGDFEIRLLYIHPDNLNEQIIDTIVDSKHIMKYFDIPIQHASNKVLKNMNRFKTIEEIEYLLDYIRQKGPEVILRTTILLGFPGEEEEDFEQLLKFVKKIKFDRLGSFVYSDEENTPVKRKNLKKVHKSTAKRRWNTLMKIQREILENNIQECIGRELKILIEEFNGETENGYEYLGRSYMDSPEIDTIVLINSKSELKLGNFVECKITGYNDIDLEAEVIE